MFDLPMTTKTQTRSPGTASAAVVADVSAWLADEDALADLDAWFAERSDTRKAATR